MFPSLSPCRTRIIRRGLGGAAVATFNEPLLAVSFGFGFEDEQHWIVLTLLCETDDDDGERESDEIERETAIAIVGIGKERKILRIIRGRKATSQLFPPLEQRIALCVCVTTCGFGW
ncbi:hypothetical protein PanWU01x14_136030 [Parasponia andersonii]|uniref:Uncharacterized protein n=1 Tax=Parasponia andersonii TaxID=3476 RepID=A0A2P5CPF3_PARAD|nr:hypothetical protein PanWU01x14_136030 [Parasponia andersonii]